MLCRVLYKNHFPSSSRWTYEADAMVIPTDHPSGLVA